MIKIISALIIFSFGSVLAIDHLIFDADFIAGKHKLIHHVNFASHKFGSAKGEAIRFLHFVPLLGSKIGGFAGSKVAHFDAKTHNLIKLDDGEIIEFFTGFSDCFSWFAFHIAIWNEALSTITHKFAAFIKDSDNIFKEKIFSGIVELAEFIKSKILRDHFSAIHDKSIAATPLTLIMHKIMI